ncbi:MAG TPA: nucleoside-diphosphate kinase [Anaerolineales bacterium]|nr:nucleoside-diphosphate kinase [Anaerolineales bacterium]
MDRSLVIVKPDGVQRGLTGEVISRIERRGYRLVAVKMLQVPRSLAESHYAVHAGKSFYDGLVSYICSSPVVVMVWEGKKVIEAVRQVVGATNPTNAAPGTLRGDYAVEVGRNLVHASDSPENGQAEVALWFRPEELVAWERIGENWLYE